MATNRHHGSTTERVSPDIADEKDSLPALEETTSDTSARPTTNVMGTGQGWTELKEDGGRVRHLLLHDSKNGSAQDVELEETETMRTGTGAVPPGADPNAPTAGAAGAVEYRVYKRRWFGLVQLALLNIIVSWDWLTFSAISAYAADYFNTDETTINWLSTSFQFSFVFITPVVIYVLHLGVKLSITTAAALIFVGNWIRYAGAHSGDGGNFGVVMFGQILTGLAQAFVLSAPTRYSDLWFSNRGRVAATAVASLANPFGAALGQLIIPFWVNQASDVSSAVLYVAIISTVAAIPSFFIPSKPPTPVAPSAEEAKLTLGQSIKILTGQLEPWLILIPFAVYVGFFNSVSTLLNQILEPYGLSDTDAGIAGAVLIVVGLVAAAIASPIIDRTKSYLLAVKVCVPVLGVSLLIFYWMPPTGGIPGPYVVLAVVGAAAFSLLPIAMEFLVELTHPISPEVTSTLAWSSGQLLGGVFIVISDALKAGPDGDPPYNMQKALIFTAVIALLAVPPPMCLGLFGRGDRLELKRVTSDAAVLRRHTEASA